MIYATGSILLEAFRNEHGSDELIFLYDVALMELLDGLRLPTRGPSASLRSVFLNDAELLVVFLAI